MKKVMYIILGIFLLPLMIKAQNVGIGTTTPARTLDIVDSIDLITDFRVSGGSSGGLVIEHVKVSEQVNLFSVDGLLQIGVGSTAGSLDTRFRMNADGVKIGGGNPTNLFHLEGTDPLRMEGLQRTTASLDSLLVVDGEGVVKYVNRTDILPAGSGYWSRNTTNDLYYLDSVGIGVSNPFSLFTVYDFDDDLEVRFGTEESKSELILNAVADELKLGQYAEGTSGTLLNSTVDKSGKGYLWLPKPVILARSAGPVNTDQGLIIGTEDSVPIVFATHDQEQMRIDSFGHVGINTATPRRDFHVDGVSLFTDSLVIGDIRSSIHKNADHLQIDAEEDLRLNAGPNDDVKILEDGRQYAVFQGRTSRFGLGTNTPDRILHVEGSGLITDTTFVGGFETYVTKSSSNLIVESEDANVELRAGGVSRKVLVYDKNTEWVTFDGADREVGINTSTPNEALEVVGNSLVSDTMFLRNDDNYISYSPSFNGVVVQSDDDIELRVDNNERVEMVNGNGRYAYFDGSLEQLNLSSPTSGNPPLFVNGKAEVKELMVTTGAMGGHVLVSDAFGNATWGPTPPDSDWTTLGGGSHLTAGVPGYVSIGGPITAIPPSKLSVEGSFSLPIKTINSSVYPYGLSFQDHTIVCLDPAAQINLPAASAARGRVYVLKFDATPATLNPAIASDKIEGFPAPFMVAPVPGSPFNTITIQSDGVDGWWIISN